MGYLDIWYEQFGGREQSEHAESIELWGRAWSIGDKVFSLYDGWGEIKTIWRYPLGNQRERAWMCHASFLSGNYEVERLYSLNIWMTEASFASERGERTKSVTAPRRSAAAKAERQSVTLPRRSAAAQARAPKCDTTAPLDTECPPIWECPKGYRWCHCEECRRWFPSKRYHAKTCGAKCRKALSRKQT